MQKVKLVFAVAFQANEKEYAFGNKGGLPWGHVKEDLAHFKAETKDTVLVMGANTFNSLPGKLPGRPHVVLSNHAEHLRTKRGDTADMVLKGGNLATTIDAIRLSYPDKDISIIGGKSLIEEAIKYSIPDQIILSVMCNSLRGKTIEFDVGIDAELLELENNENYDQFDEVYVEDTEYVHAFFIERWEKVKQ